MNDMIDLPPGDRSKLKAVRLQSYWKKLCEDEERSRRRNEQLLREFDRVEAHMAVLAERTQRQQRIKAGDITDMSTLHFQWRVLTCHVRHVEMKRCGNPATLCSIH